MKRLWFKTLLGILTVTGWGVGVILSPNQAEAYQGATTPTGIYATVTYSDPINVRGGPNTVYYPIVGRLSPGDVVPALGVSAGHEWVQISYPAAGAGVGWVYAIYVNTSGGELHVVEPPPTPAPLATASVDPTFAAAFNIQPTQTGVPTFTPPPPLNVPQFVDASTPRSSGIVSGIFIIILMLMGGIGLVISYVLRR